METHYHPPLMHLWEGRPSRDQAYIHENIRLLDLGRDTLPKAAARLPVLLGYACDEGVRRNLGRPGARTGPLALRKALGKMPLLKGAPSPLLDAGDLACDSGDMEGTQEAFAEKIKDLVTAGYLPLGIGGGHDISFGHYLGLRQALGPAARLGIVNFDAHFDLRKPVPLPHSGSPFLQIASHCRQSGSDFLYSCVGVRRDANPQELWDRAASLESLIITREELDPGPGDAVLEKLGAFMESLDALYLTIDLDGFSSAYAPGVSAASPMGYSPQSLMPCLDLVLSGGQLTGMDIAELNPAQDRDGQTAVLAASLIHRVLHQPGLF